MPRVPVVGAQRPQHARGAPIELGHARHDARRDRVERGRDPRGPTGRRARRRSRPRGSRGARPWCCASSAARVVNRTCAGVNDGPSASATHAADLGAQRVVGATPGREHDEHPQRLALQLVGDADRGRLDHRRVRDHDGLDLGRTEPLARELDRVVGAAVQEPLAVVDRRSRSRRATTRPGSATSTSRGSARGSWYRPRVIPGHGFVHTSSPTAPRTGWPSSSNTSTAMPSAGPPSEHGEIGCDDVRREEARADLGAARDVDRPGSARRRRRRSTSATDPRSTARRSTRGRAATTGRARAPARRRAPSARGSSVGETPRTLMRWRSTIAHSRSGPGKSGAPS